ncbi:MULTISPECIES: hypothetical protein [Streptomyces]|uniref:Uncharacterized protein n=1 Tax=Streptomyces ramulosus TaxID=47762 RepID=A0ABW1FCF9_9ACTN
MLVTPGDRPAVAYRTAGRAGHVVAIEAIGDGDTVHDWFVQLLAITADPAAKTQMATIDWSTAKLYLGEDADCRPRHPVAVAVAAERAGSALAAHLSVPFHFASPPDTPDDEAPRQQS